MSLTTDLVRLAYANPDMRSILLSPLREAKKSPSKAQLEAQKNFAEMVKEKKEDAEEESGEDKKASAKTTLVRLAHANPKIQAQLLSLLDKSSIKLNNGLIRLAYANPKLRPQLLSLIQKKAW